MERLRVFLQAPEYPGDEENSMLASQVHSLAGVMLALLVVYTVLALFLGREFSSLTREVGLLGFAYAFVLGVLWLNRSGRVGAAAQVVIWAVWLILWVSSFTSGGVTSVNFTALMLAVILAGLLLGPWMAIVFTVLNIVTGALFLALEANPQTQSLMHLAQMNVSGGWYLLVQAIYFILAMVLVEVYTRRIRSMFGRYEAELASRKHIESQLKMKGKLLNLIMQKSNTGILLFDEHGTIFEWNETLEQITGWRRLEAVGCPAWEMQYRMLHYSSELPATPEGIRAGMEDILKMSELEGNVEFYKYQIHNRRGQVKTIEVAMLVIELEGSKVGGSIVRQVADEPSG